MDDEAPVHSGDRAASQGETLAQHHTAQPVTVQAYAKGVRNFSRLPSGTGQNHERLARFLSSLTTHAEAQFEPPTAIERFLTVYRFNLTQKSLNLGATLQPPSSSTSTAPLIKAAKWAIGDARHFSSCLEYARESQPSAQESPGQIMFLRGYPSADWLGLIGSAYRVDPEMFSRWLDFRSADDRSNNFSLPSLPSSGWNLLELPVVTIGSRDPSGQNPDQSYINASRRETADVLRIYHDRLYSGVETLVGSSIVRDLCLFDESHFAIEQRITICMQPKEGSKGWVLLVWTDSGNDSEADFLNQRWTSALESIKSRGLWLWPVIRYRPNMGLYAHLIHKGESERTDTTLQSASLLHLDYGRSLRTHEMASDPFYALYEVFTLAAASEKQFLNLLEHKLNQYTAGPDDDDFDGLPNLKYLRETLFRHLRQIQGALLSIKNTKEPKWPKPSEDVAIRARSAVEQDYAHLYDHAQLLNTRCQETIAILMNSISILESKKAITQAERMGKLTFLAFIFVPLSFTTGFFGMNITELHDISIWVWFLLSILILCFVLVVFFCDVRHYCRRANRIFRDQIRRYLLAVL